MNEYLYSITVKFRAIDDMAAREAVMQSMPETIHIESKWPTDVEHKLQRLEQGKKPIGMPLNKEK